MTLYRTPQHFVSRKLTRFALATPLLMSLMACSQTPSVESKVIDDEKVTEIQQTIAEKYPNADVELQHHILDVAIKAIDNMVFIQGGSFMMGDFGMSCNMDVDINLAKWEPGASCMSSITSVETGANYLHKVTLSSYSLAKFETTYYDMNAYRLAHELPLIKARFNAKRLKRATPVKSWHEAKDYCTWLGELTGYPFDLPTEAQWEYAARNRGQNIYYATDDGEVRPKKSGRYIKRPDGSTYKKDWQPEEWNYPTPDDYHNDVDSWPPNPLGIYALSSGPKEWVNDWYSSDYYQHSPEHDPQGPKTGTNKVQRGGQGNRPVVMNRFIGENTNEYYVSDGVRCGLQQDTAIQ